MITISKVKKYILFFVKNTGWKLPLFVAVTFTATIFESIGFSLFIPLLSESNLSQKSNLKIKEFISKVFSFFGLEYNLKNIIFAILFIFTFSLVLKGVQNVAKVYITASVRRRWKEKIIDLLGKISYTKFISYNSGYLANILTQEVSRAVGSFSQACMLIIAAVNILIYFTFACFLSLEISIFSGIVGIILMFLLKKLFSLSEKISKRMSGLFSKTQEILIQMLHSYKYLKATSVYEKLLNKIYGIIGELFKVEVKQSLVEWAITIFLEIVAVWIVLGIIYYHVVIKGNDIGSILVLALFFYKTIKQINILPVAWNSFLTNAGGLYVVSNAFSDFESSFEDTGKVEVRGIDDGIEFRSVSFAYGDKPVLSDINMKIGKNKTVAIVGPSGAGKSTIVDMITGILKPTSGKILVDGVDMRDIDINSFRKHIGYVTQEIVVYDESIINNVSLWDAEKGGEGVREAVLDALAKAKCDTFIKESDIYMLAGDRGVNFSVGQRQRLAIARELYKNTDILIFDEATSALDTESELFIQESINSLKHKKTIVLIAHRLSTIKNSDYIYVVNEGKIVESGTYAELYENENSYFRKMCKLQHL